MTSKITEEKARAIVSKIPHSQRTVRVTTGGFIEVDTFLLDDEESQTTFKMHLSETEAEWLHQDLGIAIERLTDTPFDDGRVEF